MSLNCIIPTQCFTFFTCFYNLCSNLFIIFVTKWPSPLYVFLFATQIKEKKLEHDVLDNVKMPKSARNPLLNLFLKSIIFYLLSQHFNFHNTTFQQCSQSAFRPRPRLRLTCPCALLTSAACCRRSATCAAMTRCRSTTSRQQAQRQSLQRQKRLWPFKHDTTPWFRQRAHLGLRVILRAFCCWWPTLFSPPRRSGQPRCAAQPSERVTSTTFSDLSLAVVSSCGPPSS